MFNSRISSIIRKEFLQLFRDPRTLALAVVIPIVQLFLLGYSATNDVRNVPLAVLDQSRSARETLLGKLLTLSLRGGTLPEMLRELATPIELEIAAAPAKLRIEGTLERPDAARERAAAPVPRAAFN